MNIKKFLEDHDIYYTESGPNTKRGNISIKCPYCGEADKSEHMGIQIEPPNKFGCWRNSQHRGSNVIDLIVALTDYSWSEARQIAEADKPILDGKSTLDAVTEILDKEQDIVEQFEGVDYLEFPKNFNTVIAVGIYRKFHSYLFSRGIEHKDINKLVRYYNLKGCLSGEFAFRLIIPVYFGSELTSWTGRSISQKHYLRYMDLSPSKSVVPLKESLYDYDNLTRGGKRLYITEGAFDCYPIFLHGGDEVGVTCTFTVSLSERQRFLLGRLAKVYDEVVILPDSKFEMRAYKLKKDLAYLKNVHVQTLPKGVSDPGDLSKRQVCDLVCEEF